MEMNQAPGKVTVEWLRIAGEEPIPTIIVRPTGVDSPPAVIIVHGYAGSKDDHLEEAVRIAAAGVTVVNIDARAHGERKNPAVLLDPPDPWDFYHIIAGTARDVSVVADYLLAQPALCNGSLGLKGGSMGGYVALAVASHDRRFDPIFSVCGGADYSDDLLRRFGHVDGVEELAALAANLDPLKHLSSFYPRRLLLVHGERDDIVPYAGQQHLYHALSPLYVGEPDRLAFISHPGYHATPLPLLEFGWQWLLGGLSAG